MQDAVAIVGVGRAPAARTLRRSSRSLALEAARKAIADAGLRKEDVNGICAHGIMVPWRNEIYYANVQATIVQDGLGIPEVTWCVSGRMGASLSYAASAVYSGACEVALVVNAVKRMPAQSRSAASDPFRVRVAELSGGGRAAPRTTTSGAEQGTDQDYAIRWGGGGGGSEPYAALAMRYLHDYGAPRELFGLIAVNNRTNATMNPHAVSRTPLTMGEYLGARMIREPLCLFDCDQPIDTAEAFVVTSAARARQLAAKPVYVHAATQGQARSSYEFPAGMPGWLCGSHWTAMKRLWQLSSLSVNDIDLAYPYDGFSVVSVQVLEAAGYCRPGEAWPFLREQWDEAENRLKLNGRVLVQSGGGSLSQGRMGGFNYITEAVLRLRGAAESSSSGNPRSALLGMGSVYHEPVAAILRVE